MDIRSITMNMRGDYFEAFKINFMYKSFHPL
jgi:hypothetical protein